MRNPGRPAGAFGLVACALLLAPLAARAQAPSLELRPHDRIVFVGNTLAERMQHFNHFETLLMARFPAHQLSVRNLGWSGDTIALQPRPLNFGDATRHLTEQKADVILAFFGLNESFDDEAGLPAFERDLDRYVAGHLAARYNGRSAPRLVLVSPIAHEHLAHLRHVDVEGRNRALWRYTEVMKRVAARQSVVFVDLLTPTRAAMARADTPLTINGIHLSAYGDRLVAGLLMDGLGLSAGAGRDANADQVKALEAMREDIRDKNQQFFYRWRPLNAEYVVGRRVDPFGAINFPDEMKELDRMVSDRDRKIWKRAQALEGLRYPPALRPTSSAAERRQ
jgi:lysophospholipase L1-like esterase